MSASLQLLRTPELREAMQRCASQPGTHWLGGGTELLPWMRGGAIDARGLLPVDALDDPRVRRIARVDTAHGPCLQLGAAVTLADAAAHPLVLQHAPLVADALRQTASPQVRHLATLAGNVLQQHRCPYWRQRSAQCGHVRPGAGCAARDGEHRHAALFGLDDSDPCIAAHASDLAVALLALDARVVLRLPPPHSPADRCWPVDTLLCRPTAAQPWPHRLPAGALVTALQLPIDAATEWRRVATFHKLRDRASFAFALLSLAAVVDVHDGVVQRARLVAGGVAPVPWRLHAAERCVEGARTTGAAWRDAIEAAVAAATQGATPRSGNAFKLELLRRLLTLALQQAAPGATA